jgi:ABC-type bacteriocin/lantibiotic exporter with double-glycine peptidase domain
MKNPNSAFTCVEHVCKHFKVRASHAPIDENVHGIIDALRSLGFYACDLRTDTIGLIDCSTPAVIQTTTRYMVVIKSNSIGVTVMDPIDGNIHRIAFQDLVKIWTGLVILIEPPQRKRSFFEKLFST